MPVLPVPAAIGEDIVAEDVGGFPALPTIDGSQVTGIPGGGDVTGPASNTAGAVPLYSGITGKILQDGPVPGAANGLATLDAGGKLTPAQIPVGLGGDVTGPAGATANAVPLYDGATGKIIKDGPTPGAALGLATLDGLTEHPAAQYKVFVGDAGGGGVKGAVPAPAAGDAAANKFLKADGNWTSIVGTGDVVGPAGATDGAVALYDGATGKLIKDGPVPGAANGLATLDAGATHTLTEYVAYVGDAGPGGTIGAVPAPPAGSGALGHLLLASGGWGQADHNLLGNVGTGDVHTMYLHVPGRPGGQTCDGGTLAGQELQLRGNAVDLGRVRMLGALEIDDVSAFDQTAIRWRPSFTVSAPYVGGLVDTLGLDILVQNATFIPGLFIERGLYRQDIIPGFTAYTWGNCLPTIQNVGNFNLPNAIAFNVGIKHLRTTAGTSTASVTGFSFSPQTAASLAAAIMTKLAQTAVSVTPTYSTVLGSTANLGPVTGLLLNNVQQALGGTGAGVETLTSYYGVHYTNIAFATSGEKNVIRSDLTPAADRYFARNLGGAQSNWGAGDHFNCGFVQILSNTKTLSMGATGGDLQLGWNGTRGVWNPLVGDNLEMLFAAGNHILQSDQFGSGSELRLGFEKTAFGQTGVFGNYMHIFVAANGRLTGAGSDWDDVLLSQAGPVDLNGNAHTNVGGWGVGAPSITLNGGSTVNAYTMRLFGSVDQGTNRYGLLVTSNPSGGTLNYCARFAGSAGVRIDGVLEHAGTTIGFNAATPVAQSTGWTANNVTVTKVFDADNTTVDELADVVGTLIDYFKSRGDLAA